MRPEASPTSVTTRKHFEGCHFRLSNPIVWLAETLNRNLSLKEQPVESQVTMFHFPNLVLSYK